jgi:hypothetical protein
MELNIKFFKMKTLRLIAILIVLLLAASCATPGHLPFAGSTKHKPITRMSHHQVKKVALGKPLYAKIRR